MEAVPTPAPVPDHVVILGLGPSCEAYVDHVKQLGGRRRFADEVWGINAVADIIQCDRVFHMDDCAVQEIRAMARPESNIAVMLTWLRTHPGPIYTSIPRDGYPGAVAFPLEDVISHLGYCYFNGTAAYAAAYAVHIGVKKISLFGCDYTMPNAHNAERGRACLEFWLGIAAARGIEIAVTDGSSLMDACEKGIKPYGYDMVTMSVEPQDDGRAKVSFVPIDVPPTADEIERRYDHARHPNPLIQE